MKTHILLILIMLSIPIQAGTIYVRFLDMTNNEYDYIDVYQNDANSLRYVKTINITVMEMQTLGTGYNYTLVLNPSRKDVLGDISNPRQLSYLLHELPQYVFYALIFGLLILIYKRR